MARRVTVCPYCGLTRTRCAHAQCAVAACEECEEGVLVTIASPIGVLIFVCKPHVDDLKSHNDVAVIQHVERR